MFSKPYLKNYFLFIFFLSSFGKSWGQNNFSIPLKIGYGFNSSISLNEDETSNVNGIIIQSGLEYEFKIYKNLFAETGLAGRAILASGKTENSSYKAKTLRLRLPVKLGWTISEKWKVASGIAIQNNKDFITIDLREKYFWRYDLLFEGKYNWVKNWFGVASINYELRNLPNAYFINDPRFVISLGVGREF